MRSEASELFQPPRTLTKPHSTHTHTHVHTHTHTLAHTHPRPRACTQVRPPSRAKAAAAVVRSVAAASAAAERGDARAVAQNVMEATDMLFSQKDSDVDGGGGGGRPQEELKREREVLFASVVALQRTSAVRDQEARVQSVQLVRQVCNEPTQIGAAVRVAALELVAGLARESAGAGGGGGSSRELGLSAMYMADAVLQSAQVAKPSRFLSIEILCSHAAAGRSHTHAH